MSECRCGRPTRDDAYGCEHCADELARALGDVPWLDEELEVTISRQKGVDYRKVGGGKGGQKAAERPLPPVWGASEARTHLRALLVSWALFCAAEDIRSSDPRADMPDDNLPALSRWLMWRVDGLMLHDIASEAVDEITSAVAHCHRLIDRPSDRQYLGTCDICSSGRLFAKAGSEWAECEECGSKVNADTVRARLLGELDDRLCTAAEIAQEDGYLLIGYPANEIAPADTRADSERDGREQIGVGNGGLAGRRALTSPDVQHHQRTVAVGGAGGSQLQAEGAKEPLAVQQEVGENDLPAQRVRIVHLGRRAPGVRSVERWSLPRVKPQGIASPRVEQVVPPENP